MYKHDVSKEEALSRLRCILNNNSSYDLYSNKSYNYLIIFSDFLLKGYSRERAEQLTEIFLEHYKDICSTGLISSGELLDEMSTLYKLYEIK